MTTADLPVVNFPVFAVGKPGINYQQANVQFSPTLLLWNLATQTTTQLEDQLVTVMKVQAQVDKWIEAVKDILKSRSDLPELKPGDQFIPPEPHSSGWIPTYTKRERTGIDSELLKTKYGDAWFAEHCKTTEYIEIRFKKAE